MVGSLRIQLVLVFVFVSNFDSILESIFILSLVVVFVVVFVVGGGDDIFLTVSIFCFSFRSMNRCTIAAIFAIVMLFS